jgi:hypothetical protein
MSNVVMSESSREILIFISCYSCDLILSHTRDKSGDERCDCPPNQPRSNHETAVAALPEAPQLSNASILGVHALYGALQFRCIDQQHAHGEGNSRHSRELELLAGLQCDIPYDERRRREPNRNPGQGASRRHCLCT